MPRIKEYGPPADLLARLPAKTIVTRGDKLALLRAIQHRAETSLMVGTDRVTFAAIMADVRAAHQRPAHKDSAPAVTRAPSRTEERIEQGSSIPPKALERKISFEDDGDLIVHRLNGIGLSWRIGGTDTVLLRNLTPDDADQLAHALTELADDLRQDANARAWSQGLLEQQR